MKTYQFLICIFLSSCFYGSLKGLTNGYNGLETQEKKRIKEINTNDRISSFEVSDTIYLIEGTAIRNFIESKKDVIIYFWGPNCSSEICYPIHVVEEKCKKNNQELIVIMDYFDFEMLDLQIIDSMRLPVFAINSDYYKSKFCNKYRTRFIRDLLQKQELETEEKFFRYYQFHNGEYVKCIDDIMN